MVFLIVPAVAAQVQDFIANLPKFLSELDQSINRLFRSIPVLRRGVTEGSGARACWPLRSTRCSAFSAARWCPTSRAGVELIIEGVSVLVMALYLARNPAIYVDGVVALVPPARRPLGPGHSVRSRS